MKLYTFFTPSHEVFFRDWFLPSLTEPFELMVHQTPQISPNGHYGCDGFKKTMVDKVKVILQGLEENPGEVFVYADIDIQFFRPMREILLQALEGKDIVCQSDQYEHTNLCAGFFACRSNERTLRLWKKIHDALTITDGGDDQQLLNDFREDVSWAVLPPEFLSGGTLDSARSLWMPGLALTVPKGIILHHANWTVGIQNKILQLQYVKDQVQSYASADTHLAV